MLLSLSPSNAVVHYVLCISGWRGRLNCTQAVHQLHPKWKNIYVVVSEWMNKRTNEQTNERMNEWMKSHVYVCPMFYSKPERTDWSLTPQLDTVIIGVSSFNALRLRAHPRRWFHRTKHLPSTNWTFGDIGSYSGQTSYLSVKVLTFPKDENMRFFYC